MSGETGEAHSALPFAKMAIELDRRYSIKAAADDDFRKYQTRIQELLEFLRRDAQERANAQLAQAQQAISLREKDIERFAELISDPSPFTEKANLSMMAATISAKQSTYFGYLDAQTCCGQAIENMEIGVKDFVTRATAEVKNRITQLNKVDPEKGDVSGKWLAGGWIATIIGSIGSCGEIQDRMIKSGERMSRVENYAFGTFFLVLIVGAVLSIGIAIMAENMRRTARTAVLGEEKARLERLGTEVCGLPTR